MRIFLLLLIRVQIGLINAFGLEDLLKPSSGNWQQDQSVRIITDDPVSSFESHSVTGSQSGATGIVNRIEQFAAGVFDITELFLTNIEGTFIVGESVDSNEVDGVSGSGIAQGLISEIWTDESTVISLRLGIKRSFENEAKISLESISKHFTSNNTSFPFTE